MFILIISSKFLFLVGDTCYNYQTFGRCNRGLTCRFASNHITPNNRNKVDVEKCELYQTLGPHTVNQLTYELQSALRKRKYDFADSEALIKYNDKKNKEKVAFVISLP